MNSKEFNTIMKLNNLQTIIDFFPKIYGGGEFIIKLPKKTPKKNGDRVKIRETSERRKLEIIFYSLREIRKNHAILS